MTAQLVLFILGIVSFVAAVILAGLAVYVFRKEDIRAVRDDLSGKTRQQDIEESQKIVKERGTQRGKAGARSVSKSASQPADSKRSQETPANKKERSQKRGRKKKAEKAAQRASAATNTRKSKSVADYQAEYTQSKHDDAWGLESATGSSDDAALPAEASSAISDSTTTAVSQADKAALEDYIASKVKQLDFKIVEQEMVVNWQEDQND